jgi:hypothetical protein
MRNLTQRGQPAARYPSPKGLAFEIADLVLAESWADAHDLRMLICLDHGGAVDEDYEEVIVFHTQLRPLDRFILWRSAQAVFIQPLVGKARRYASVAAALERIVPKQGVVLTDIAATTWPA